MKHAVSSLRVWSWVPDSEPVFQSPCVVGALLASVGWSFCSSKRRVLRCRQVGGLGGDGRLAPQMPDAPSEASLL